MKKFFVFATLFTAICSTFLYQQNLIAQRSLESILRAHEIALLRDQVLDMESQGTYAEGLADGLTRASTMGYRDGYHAAISQMGETQLVTGANNE